MMHARTATAYSTTIFVFRVLDFLRYVDRPGT